MTRTATLYPAPATEPTFQPVESHGDLWAEPVTVTITYPNGRTQTMVDHGLAGCILGYQRWSSCDVG